MIDGRTTQQFLELIYPALEETRTSISLPEEVLQWGTFELAASGLAFFGQHLGQSLMPPRRLSSTRPRGYVSDAAKIAAQFFKTWHEVETKLVNAGISVSIADAA